MLPLSLNFNKWLEENGDKLQPPVNNFLLFQGKDTTVMVVGGPNRRTDYHINETEVISCGDLQAYNELIYHYFGCENYKNLLDIMLEFIRICIQMRNLIQALKTADDALNILNVRP